MPIENEADFLGQIHAFLTRKGFSDADISNTIFSRTALETFARSGVAMPYQLLSAAEVNSQSIFPQIAIPTHLDDRPCQTSSRTILSIRNISLFFRVGKVYLPAASLGDALSPPFPALTQLVYNRYWLNVGTYIVAGPQRFSQQITTTQGMSRRHSRVFSAELGIAADDLSAKLSASSANTVIVTSKKSISRKYSLPATPFGSTSIYTVWQLIDEFILSDYADNPIEYSGQLIFSDHLYPATLPCNKFCNNTATYAYSQTAFKISE
jgi:hypothetical protein